VNAFFDDGVGPDANLVTHVVNTQVVTVGRGEFLRRQSRILRTTAAGNYLLVVVCGGASEGCPFRVGGSLLCISIVGLLDSAVEECVAVIVLLLLMLLLILEFLILERSPVFFELSCEGVFCAPGVIVLLATAAW